VGQLVEDLARPAVVLVRDARDDLRRVPRDVVGVVHPRDSELRLERALKVRMERDVEQDARLGRRFVGCGARMKLCHDVVFGAGCGDVRFCARGKRSSSVSKRRKIHTKKEANDNQKSKKQEAAKVVR